MSTAVTYRPMGARVVAILGGTCITVVLLVMWYAFAQEVRDSFRTVEVLTLWLFLGSALTMLWAIARTRVRFDDEGLRIRNGFREHSLAWTEVEQMRLGDGAPWVTLNTAGGRRLWVMAVQGADGDRAVACLQQMRARAIEAGGLTGQGKGTAG